MHLMVSLSIPSPTYSLTHSLTLTQTHTRTLTRRNNPFINGFQTYCKEEKKESKFSILGMFKDVRFGANPIKN